MHGHGSKAKGEKVEELELVDAGLRAEHIFLFVCLSVCLFVCFLAKALGLSGIYQDHFCPSLLLRRRGPGLLLCLK